jgi:hypothetical protein
MKRFREYVQLREEDEIPTITHEEDDKSKKLNKLINLAWKSHRESTLAFFRKLSKIDSEIAVEYESIAIGDPEVENSPVRKHPEKHVISPAMADVAASGVEDT